MAEEAVAEEAAVAAATASKTPICDCGIMCRIEEKFRGLHLIFVLLLGKAGKRVKGRINAKGSSM